MKFGDFMRNATPEEKEEVFLEVAQEASEEQKKVMQNHDNKFSITELPDDILRIVDAENWEKVFDEYMTTGTPNSEIEAQYMWKPDFMKEFIRTILTQRDQDILNAVKEGFNDNLPNLLHEYARWLLENPNAEPLVRRAKKNELTDQAITLVTEILGDKN